MLFKPNGKRSTLKTLLSALIGILCLLANFVMSLSVGTYRPVVLWHGMGDSCCNNQSIGAVANLIRATLPDTFVYSIGFGGDGNAEGDVRASYFGKVNDQVAEVCERLAGIEELADGFNAVGFSQGGQFLRAYVQRCNRPPVYNLITLGSQHAGIADIPGCDNAQNVWCNLARNIARRGAYLPYVQNRIIQAQYYKNPADLEAYYRGNIFLPDINNEIAASRNSDYKKRLRSLSKFVMIRFTDDTTVVPKETAWFGFVNISGTLMTPVPLRKSELYKEDWLGLRAMDGERKLVFLDAPGQHMQFSLEYFHDQVIVPYLSEKTLEYAGRLNTPSFVMQL